MSKERKQKGQEALEEIKPLANWDDDKSRSEKLVWWTRLDNRFQVEVQRIGPGSKNGYSGTLLVFDHLNDNQRLFSERVGLSYGAMFGPDISDVEEWQERILKFVDDELPTLNVQNGGDK